MNDGLKQRLIGAVVLIALAVILWPFVFGPEPKPSVLNKPAIDQPPPFKQFEIPEPENAQSVPSVGEYQRQLRERLQKNGDAGATPASANVSASTAAKSQPQPESTPAQPESKPESKPASGADTTKAGAGLDAAGLPLAWVVQVGSFQNGANASHLKDALQKQGYHAATQQRKTGEGLFTRVFIGPMVDQDRARRIQQAIHDKYPHARVERFVPPSEGFSG